MGAVPACIAGGTPACLAAGLGGVCYWGGVLGPGGGACSQGGAWFWGVPLPRGLAFCYGLLLWSSVMPFWFGGLLIEGGLLVWSSGWGRRP